MKTDTMPIAGAKPLAVPVAHAPVYPAAPGRTFGGRDAAKHPGQVQPGRKVDAAAASRVAREHTRGRHAG